MTTNRVQAIAAKVLALDDDALEDVAVQMFQPIDPDEVLAEAVAFLELKRRHALTRGDGRGDVRAYFSLLRYYAEELDRRPVARAHGHGGQIAALVRARPQPIIPAGQPSSANGATWPARAGRWN